MITHRVVSTLAVVIACIATTSCQHVASAATAAPHVASSTSDRIPPVTAASTATFNVTFAVPVITPIVTFDAVGDSITSWEGLEYSGAPRVDTSWTTAVGNNVRLDGGWARGGAEAGQMANAIRGLTLDANVFTLLAGTNDVRQGHNNTPTLATIESMGVDAEARGQCVVLVAIPPLDSNPIQAIDLNAGVSAIASAHGWVFVDPWVSWRENGRWSLGASPDGTHPGRAVADNVGATITAAIAGCSSM